MINKDKEIEFCKKQCNFEVVDLDVKDQSQSHINKNFLKNPNNSDKIQEGSNTGQKDVEDVPQVSSEDSAEKKILQEQIQSLQNKLADVSQKKKTDLERKISELNKNKEESVKMDKQFLKELKSMKISAQQFNSTDIFPHFLNMSRFKELNFVYFKLIDSLCQARYFKSCKETLCTDFCNDSPNLVNDKCFKDCSMFQTVSNKEDLYQFIIRRHSYYEAKLEVIDDKLNFDIDKTKLSLDRNLTEGMKSIGKKENSTKIMTEEERIEKMIKSKKNEIEQLKKKVIQEETNLLGLYKIKQEK